jgi:hypothetical protein
VQIVLVTIVSHSVLFVLLLQLQMPRHVPLVKSELGVLAQLLFLLSVLHVQPVVVFVPPPAPAGVPPVTSLQLPAEVGL